MSEGITIKKPECLYTLQDLDKMRGYDLWLTTLYYAGYTDINHDAAVIVRDRRGNSVRDFPRFETPMILFEIIEERKAQDSFISMLSLVVCYLDESEHRRKSLTREDILKLFNDTPPCRLVWLLVHRSRTACMAAFILTMQNLEAPTA
jgi:hypothetical protein